MPCPRLASGASGASWSWGSCHARVDHRYLDCLRRSVLLRHHRLELSSSQKNASHFEKVLMSEPLSKPSPGPSRQSLCMKIDSHSCAFFLAVTRIIHRPHEKGNQPCSFPRRASDTLCLSASCCSCTARPNLSGHPSNIYLSSSKKICRKMRQI